MRRKLICSLVLIASTVAAQESRPPLGDGVETLARVNGEPITMPHLLQYLGSMHERLAAPEVPVRRPDPYALLKRIVNTRLVIQEASHIGLDELPAVIERLEKGRRGILKDLVIKERLKDVVEGDPEMIERFFRDAVREIQLESALFTTQESAESFRAKVSGGSDFQKLGAEMMVRGSATAVQPGEFLPVSKLQPSVAKAVLALENGRLSAPLPVPTGFTVVRRLAEHFPEDPEARSKAEEEALAITQELTLAEYSEELRERYSQPDRELIGSLDFDVPPPDMERLLADDRVIVEIKGAEPIRVSELTVRLKDKFYHGIGRAVDQKRVNQEVPGVVDRIILERATELEAKRLGIDNRPAFHGALMALEEGTIFGVFVAKVVDPSLKVEEQDLRAFYEKHRTEYTSPTMIRLEGLAFLRRETAEAAMSNLRQGAEFRWIQANASGQASPEGIGDGWLFDGTLLPFPGLRPEIQKALVDAKAGDYRMCPEPGGPFHVLRVAETFPPKTRPFEEVREAVEKRVLGFKRQESIEHWMEELRKASEIEMFVDEEQLRALLGVESGETA